MDKIEYLCQEINIVEWSGVLFYSVKGSIKDFDKVELTVEDIYLMDKGTAGATGYELGEDFIEYRMNNPRTLSWKIGMVHSHHNMKSYFSGTDMEELDDNTEFHNYYLSLVVNNHKELVAKVAFRGDVKGYECKDENGKAWTLKLTSDRQIMFTFDCDIQSPKTTINVGKSFADRTAEIIKKANIKTAKFLQNGKKYFPSYSKDYTNPFNTIHKNVDKEMDDMEAEMWNKSFSNVPIHKKMMSREEMLEDFTRVLIRGGEENNTPGDSLEDALTDSEFVTNVEEYVSRITIMYPAIFEKYWDVFGEINTESFIETTIEVIEVLEVFDDLFKVVDPLVKGLEAMISKMQVNG